MLVQAHFVKLCKRSKALAGSQEALEKQGKALQELHGKQCLEMDALRDDASRSGQSHAPITTSARKQLFICFWHCQCVP